MSEARAICTQCTWRGLVDITPARPMGAHSCPRCGRRELRYIQELPPMAGYGPPAGETAKTLQAMDEALSEARDDDR